MIGKYHLALYNVLESYYEFQGDTLKIEKKKPSTFVQRPDRPSI